MKTAIVIFNRCTCGSQSGEYHRHRCPRMVADNVRHREPYCSECGFPLQTQHAWLGARKYKCKRPANVANF